MPSYPPNLLIFEARKKPDEKLRWNNVHFMLAKSVDGQWHNWESLQETLPRLSFFGMQTCLSSSYTHPWLWGVRGSILWVSHHRQTNKLVVQTQELNLKHAHTHTHKKEKTSNRKSGAEAHVLSFCLTTRLHWATTMPRPFRTRNLTPPIISPVFVLNFTYVQLP